MRLFISGCFAFFASIAQAFPVTYEFSGYFTSMQLWKSSDPDHSSTNYLNDPHVPVIVDGQTIFNGDTIMVGSITIDHEIDVESWPSSPSSLYWGQLLDWHISFGGFEAYPLTPGSTSHEAVGYWPGKISIHEETPNTPYGMVPDVLAMAFYFREGAFYDYEPDVLPVESFLDGSFQFTGLQMGSGGERLRGNVYGTITKLNHVTEVPESTWRPCWRRACWAWVGCAAAAGISSAHGMSTTHPSRSSISFSEDPRWWWLSRQRRAVAYRGSPVPLAG